MFSLAEKKGQGDEGNRFLSLETVTPSGCPVGPFQTSTFRD